jgi:hypothetical protein
MKQPIAHRGLTNHARFWIGNSKLVVGLMFIDPRAQFPLERKDVILQAVGKVFDIHSFLFAGAKFRPGCE